MHFPLENHPEELAINGTKDILYYRYPGGIYKIGIDATEPEMYLSLQEQTDFILWLMMKWTTSFMEPIHWIMFRMVGYYRYNARNGAIIDTIEAGIIPGEIYFVP